MPPKPPLRGGLLAVTAGGNSANSRARQALAESCFALTLALPGFFFLSNTVYFLCCCPSRLEEYEDSAVADALTAVYVFCARALPAALPQNAVFTLLPLLTCRNKD